MPGRDNRTVRDRPDSEQSLKLVVDRPAHSLAARYSTPDRLLPGELRAHQAAVVARASRVPEHIQQLPRSACQPVRCQATGKGLSIEVQRCMKVIAIFPLPPEHASAPLITFPRATLPTQDWLCLTLSGREDAS